MNFGRFLKDLLAGTAFTFATPYVTPRPPVVQPPPPPPVTAEVVPPSVIAASLIAAHNAVRAKAGLKPFLPDAKLQAAAQDHANFMAKTGVMGHFGIGDGDDAARVAKYGYLWSELEENVAAGQRSVTDVMGDWMESPGHRVNVLGSARDFGGAVAYGPFRPGGMAQIYWCTVFATPLGVGR